MELLSWDSKDAPFLDNVDLIGTAYEENFIATGFGAYLSIPLIREKVYLEMDEGESRSLLEDCLTVMFLKGMLCCTVLLLHP